MRLERSVRILVRSYELAHRDLEAFDRAVHANDKRVARTALQSAAENICAGLTALKEDPDFWAAMGNQLARARIDRKALDAALADLDRLVEEEGRILERAGLSRAAVTRLVGEFACQIRAFKANPTGDNLALARGKVSNVQEAICEVSRAALRSERSLWGRAFRVVKVGIKVLGGAASIGVNVAVQPLVVPVAVASVLGGLDMIISVGDVLKEGRENRR